MTKETNPIGNQTRYNMAKNFKYVLTAIQKPIACCQFRGNDALRISVRTAIAATLFCASTIVLSQQDQTDDRKSDMMPESASISWLPGENYNILTGEMGHYMTDLVFEGNGIPIVVARTDNTSINLAPEFRYMALAIPTLTYRNGNEEGSWGSCERIDLLNAYPHKKGNDASNQHSPIVFHLGKAAISFFSVKDYEQPHQPGIARFPAGADFVSPSNWYIDCVGENDAKASHTSLRVYSPDGMIYTLDKIAGWRHHGYRMGTGKFRLMSKSSYRLTRIADAYGNSLIYEYEGGKKRIKGARSSSFPRLTRIYDPRDGRSVDFEYATYSDDNHRSLLSVKSNGVPNPHVVTYSYPSHGNLSVTYDGLKTVSYFIDSKFKQAELVEAKIRKITYPEGGTVIYNYDPVKFDASHYQVNPHSRGVYNEYDMLISRIVDDKVSDSNTPDGSGTATSGTYHFRFAPTSVDSLSRFIDTPDTTLEYNYGKLNKDGRRLVPSNPLTPEQGRLLFYKNYGHVLSEDENIRAAAGQLVPLYEKRFTYKYLENSSVTRSYPSFPVGDDAIQMAGASRIVPLKITTTLFGRKNGRTHKFNFNREFLAYDEYGQPKQIKETSLEGSRIIRLYYRHSFSKWIRSKISARYVKDANDGEIYDSRNFEYNRFGSVTKTQVNGITNSIEYHIYPGSAFNGLIKKTIDGSGNTHQYQLYFRGIATRETDPSGRELSRSVNADGTVHAESQWGLDSRWVYEYDKARRLKTIKSPRRFDNEFPVKNIIIRWINNRHRRETREGVAHENHTYYDGFGREIFSGTRNGRGDSTWVSVKSSYDSQGRLSFRSYPQNVSNTNREIKASDNGTFYRYDGLSRLIRTQEYADGVASDIINRWEYHGMQITHTNGRGVATVTQFDSYGAPSYQYPTRSEDPQGIITTYERDPDYRLRLYVRDGQARSYNYNNRRELSAQWLPENGSTHFYYHLNGWLEFTTNGNTRTDYTYFPDGQLASETYSGDGDSVHRLYSYDHRGFLVSLSNTAGEKHNEWEYDYDAEGNLTSETLQVDGRSYTLKYQFDDLSNLHSITYPNGRVYLHSPDGFGRARSLTDGGGNVVYNSITYHPDGRAHRLERGTHSVVNTLDVRQRPYERQMYRNKDRYYFANQRYGYDKRFNLTVITDAVYPRISTFGYDNLDRLKIAAIDNETKWFFYYNGTDDFTTIQQGEMVSRYSYGSGTRLLHSISSKNGKRELTYNTQGDVVRHDSLSPEGVVTTRTLKRNAAGQIIGLFSNSNPDYTMKYAYDGNGRRVSKSRNGTVYTVYGSDGKLRFREDMLSGVTSEYLYVANELIMRRDRGQRENPSVSVPVDNRPAGIKNASRFRATAYSSQSAELYWTSAVDEKHGKATEYAIYRDGQLLQTTKNDSSLWLSGMSKDSIHTFQIVAIYASGSRSEKSDPITLRIAAQQQSY